MSETSMTIMVNGEERRVAEGSSVAALLGELGLGERPVLVERNGTALFPREFVSAVLAPGDRLEIIRIVAGG